MDSRAQEALVELHDSAQQLSFGAHLHDLLAGGVLDQVAENAATADRTDRLLELHRRRVAERVDRVDGPRHALSPLQDRVEVSTTRYRPTRTIWNDVVARWQTCFLAGCDRPATDCELDHRVPWPSGETSNRNLEPACGRDHHAKHAPGFDVATDSEAGPVLTTRAGSRIPWVPPSRRPGSTSYPTTCSSFSTQRLSSGDARRQGGPRVV